MDQVSIRDVDRDLIASVTLTDIYGYMTYLSRDRVLHQNSQRLKGTQRRLPCQKAGHHSLLLRLSLQQGPCAGGESREGYGLAQAEKDPAPLSDTGGEHGPLDSVDGP